MKKISFSVFLLGIHSISASALAVQHSTQLTSSISYPFTHLVAFGDELSDNGNGSSAHGITGDSSGAVYGYRTWTNGPVAVSYLSDLLGVPLQDYAFGGCCGGASSGATTDNTYAKSPAGAPSLKDQINNYTTTYGSDPSVGFKNSLQFIWVGQNDIDDRTDPFWLGDPHNTWVANNVSSSIAGSVAGLLQAGAPYVFVVGIYPKQIAPVTAHYLCHTNSDCVTSWGKIIQQVNQEIQSSLSQFGNKVIYYDVYDFLVNLTKNAVSNGFTQPLSSFCDGDGDASWTLCMTQKKADEFFWMTFVQPTTRVHEMIARDMKKAIDDHFRSCKA